MLPHPDSPPQGLTNFVVPSRSALPGLAQVRGGASPRMAIVHDWLTQYAGSERVLEQLLYAYPQAALFAVCDFLKDRDRHFLQGRQPKLSFIQKMPFARRNLPAWLPFMPLAIEQLDVSNVDIVLSSSHAVAKGVLTGPDQLHISYVHTPLRYAWEMQHQYLQGAGLKWSAKACAARAVLHYMRQWDHNAAQRADHLLANSRYIARRIWKCYRRKSRVIYPPVDTQAFAFCPQKDDYYLAIARMVPYKRVDVIVEAFTNMPQRKLVVIGEGPDSRRLRAIAGPNVEFLDHQPLCKLRDYLQRARAFVFAAEEDFGITAVEAQACGTPVIAFGRGGLTETVVAEQTGVFFPEQSPASLQQAVAHFESIEHQLDPYRARAQSERFSVERFRRRMTSFVSKAWEQFRSKNRERPGVRKTFVTSLVGDSAP